MRALVKAAYHRFGSRPYKQLDNQSNQKRVKNLARLQDVQWGKGRFFAVFSNYKLTFQLLETMKLISRQTGTDLVLGPYWSVSRIAW